MSPGCSVRGVPAGLRARRWAYGCPCGSLAGARFPAPLGPYPSSGGPQDLFRELSSSGTEFGRQWERGEIGTWRSAMKRVNHPTRGLLAFDSEMLHDPENDHWVMLFTPRRA
ncbi:hypothetical protein ACFWPV_00050 [Streptomyces uncialis]|uniref:MmyB family transcriptional regulator n=1 Tax=Streptomyces uncialis TaxID=1048205 RepID=UPI003647A516